MSSAAKTGAAEHKTIAAKTATRPQAPKIPPVFRFETDSFMCFSGPRMQRNGIPKGAVSLYDVRI
jgi:hypothetical protein